jgi:homoserine O-acetyltransferase/O-succinyltransferase
MSSRCEWFTLQSMSMIVEKQFYTFAYPPGEFLLESGRSIGPVSVAYETCGTLNQARNNVILITHGLSADSHAAGLYDNDDQYAGWWDGLIGPGKAIDTDHYFVVCSNVIGSCKGSSGPNSIYPITGKAYGMLFPIVTVNDMVRVQYELMCYLGVASLHSVVGGSLGGMQALAWSMLYPEMVRSVIPIAVSARLSPQGIAFNEIGRQCIMSDQNWRKGNYYDHVLPKQGLALARMVGHITYLSDEKLNTKFGRRRQRPDLNKFNYESLFQIESYLHHKGHSFVDNFDANAYIYMTKAIDFFDLSAGYDNLKDAVSSIKMPTCLVGFSSDWLFSALELKEIYMVMDDQGLDVDFHVIESFHGHDGFLLETDKLGAIVRGFLSGIKG